MNPLSTSPDFPVHGGLDRAARGFSLIELLIAMSVLSIMLLFFADMTGMVADTWSRSESRVETYQNGRAALELMTREMTSAVVDTRMQFAIGPKEILERAGAENLAENSPCALWMAPIGPGGDLRCVGYYLYRDDKRKFYRLKRLYMGPENDRFEPPKENFYFPRIATFRDKLDSWVMDTAGLEPVRPTDARWFYNQSTGKWSKGLFDEEDPKNDWVAVSTAADGIIALWFQPIDLLGNPIPWVSKSSVHPKPSGGHEPLIYNSAAYFSVATSKPFKENATFPWDDDETFAYLAESPFAMKGNRVPAAVDITIVCIDERSLVRISDFPVQTNEMTPMGALDVGKSIREFNKLLISPKYNITNARTFTTRVKLVNGS